MNADHYFTVNGFGAVSSLVCKLEQSEEAFSGEDFAVPRYLIREAGNQEVKSVQVVLQRKVDFGEVHCIS